MRWTILARPAFLKDLAALPPEVRARIEPFVFTVLPTTENPHRLGKLEKLKGHPGFYKVRFGHYRLGLLVDGRRKQVHLLRVLHRRDIYRHFP